MCGIIGILSFEKPLMDHIWIENMSNLVKHRGPDDEGYLFLNLNNKFSEERSGENTIDEIKNKLKPIQLRLNPYHLVFGHRRLSIIDLTYLGHQPMSYENGKYWITYNGEIFNYLELKNELIELGYKFKTNSDTEVILASYKKWGTNCVKHFNGDWAFCIFDKINNILFGSRDRYGVKNLYFYFDKNLFTFASEIKALLSLPFIKKDLDIKNLIEYLLFGLIDHSDSTFFKNIKQIKPGQYFILDIKNKDLKIFNYYELNFNPELGKYDQKKSIDYIYNIREIFIDSIKIRLRSDVPIGSCLSGGIDSSSIVTITNNLILKEGISSSHIKDRQKTFTASYINDPIDETIFANEIIKKTGVDAKFTFPNGEKLWEELDNLIYYQDGPFGSTSIYAQWNVMRLASQYVKVVLDGQGGDELFGGYLFYPSFSVAQGNWNLFLQRLKIYKLKAFQEIFYIFGFKFFQLIPDIIKDKFYPIIRRKYFNYIKNIFPQIDNYIFSFKEILDDVIVPNLNFRLWQDFTKYSIPNLLHYEDRNSMAFSIEARVPFLDYRLVDYVMNIPGIYKIYNGWTKWIFRLTMKDFLPTKVLWRKDKIGFSTPEKKWLLNGENPFKVFIRKYQIPYDGDFFWWRLFTAFYWINKGKIFK